RIAELLRENERRIAQQSAFFRIAAILGQPLSLDETGRALAEAANDALGGVFAAVLLPSGDTLELVDIPGLPDVLVEALARGVPERSELFEAEWTARALSQQLARTGGVLAGELDPAAVLEEVVQQAAALLTADACAVRTLEDDELVVSAAWGKGAEDAVDTRV